MVMLEPSQQTIVQRYLDWDRVDWRLSRHENIAATWDIAALRQCRNRGPYYCHHMAWRLGTWPDEAVFEQLDTLLAHAITLDNWDEKKQTEGLAQKDDFGEFWELAWELQVAKSLSDLTEEAVEWMEPPAPDLKVNTTPVPFYVECGTYGKSCRAVEFIEELFSRLNTDPETQIEVYARLYEQMALPKDLRAFLDELFRPYLEDSDYLPSKSQEARRHYPVVLDTPEGADNLFVCVHGSDPDAYDAACDPTGFAAAPQEYLNTVVQGAVEAKRDCKELADHHPNLLAVNCVLGESLRTTMRGTDCTRPEYSLGEAADAAYVTSCSIDEIPWFDPNYVQAPADHPFTRLLST
jgi:hypothetical protein